MRISEVNLRHLIRDLLLTEKTRYEKETGKKFDLADKKKLQYFTKELELK